MHPILVAKANQIINAMIILQCPVLVTQGLRTAEEQAALYAQGRTKPGKVVTNCDGVTTKSNHQAAADGFGHAIDFAFLTPDLGVTWEGPWDLLGAMARALGLKWGGDFHSFPDRPHVELK